MLTTGVDVPTCKNVVLVRVINSMTEFKQIIGRGTRMREDYGKTWFNIIDYTGSATVRFADPDFDGYPEEIDIAEIDGEGKETATKTVDPTEQTTESADPRPGDPPTGTDGSNPNDGGGRGDGVGEPAPRKYYVDGGQVEIVGHLVYELDGDGKQLRVIQYTDYTADQIRTLFRIPTPSPPTGRTRSSARRSWRNWTAAGSTSLTWPRRPLDPMPTPGSPLPPRLPAPPAHPPRAGGPPAPQDQPDFFDQFSALARGILDALLDQYTEHGPGEFQIPHALKAPTIAAHGNADGDRRPVRRAHRHAPGGQSTSGPPLCGDSTVNDEIRYP